MAPAETPGVDFHPAAAESAKMPGSMMLAQINIGRIIGGDSQREDSEHGGGQTGQIGPRRIPSTPLPVIRPNHDDDDQYEPGEGGHTPIIPIPIPIRPLRPYRPYYPRPDYTPIPNYVPRPDYTPGTTPAPVPSNVLPTQPQPAVQPEVNVVPVDPKPNNLIADLGVKPITPQQLAAFKKQITKKSVQLGADLKKLLPGNDQAIDQLVALANSGKLTPLALQQFVGPLGPNLALQVQLQVSGLLKQLAFNNLAMAALLNVNINLLNLNLINININIVGGGVLGGFWGFPWWPWSYPIWLGPGVWWGPCAYCPYPYYNPLLNGADALGIPYSIAQPAPNYAGKFITSGILLTNAGGAAVNYTVNGRRYTMQPNYQQAIARRRIAIAFSRGGSFGSARYGIDEGWYQFTATDRGWELYKHTAKITLDNADNPFSFNYVLNNQSHTLKGGYRQELTGKYPLELKFDNGKGQVVRRVLVKGDFKIALGGDGTLELFKPEDVNVPAPIAEMAKKADQKPPNLFAEPEKIPSLFGDSTAAVPPPPPDEQPAPGEPSLFGPPK